jgi:hypothetical protein
MSDNVTFVSLQTGAKCPGGVPHGDLVVLSSWEGFHDFMGLLAKTKRGIKVILVVIDSFSKFVRFFPVRKLTSREVATYWKRDFSPLVRFPNRLSHKAKAFKSKASLDFCFK